MSKTPEPPNPHFRVGARIAIYSGDLISSIANIATFHNPYRFRDSGGREWEIQGDTAHTPRQPHSSRTARPWDAIDLRAESLSTIRSVNWKNLGDETLIKVAELIQEACSQEEDDEENDEETDS